jgi:rRNA maturation endonuclease Nob1
MGCRGICSRHKAMRPSTGNRYLIGQKRCQGCQIFINWPGFFCPCCGYRLRNKPRNKKKYNYKLILSNNIINKINR